MKIPALPPHEWPGRSPNIIHINAASFSEDLHVYMERKGVLFSISNDTLCVSDLVTSTWRTQRNSCKRRHCCKVANKCMCVFCSPCHPPSHPTLPHTKGQKKLFVVSYSSKAQWNPTEVFFLFSWQFHPAPPQEGKPERRGYPVLQARQQLPSVTETLHPSIHPSTDWQSKMKFVKGN